MISRKDVAELANVSTATVSHVINNTKYVSPELRIRVEQAVQKLNYKPNIIARSLATNKSHTVGLLVDNIINPYYGEIAQGMEEVAYKNGYDISLYLTNKNTTDYLDRIIARKLDGVFIATTDIGFTNTDLKVLNDYGVAVVTSGVNEYSSGVMLNYDKAVDKATQYLIDLGHKKIAYIIGDIDRKEFDPRYIQYKKTLEKNGIDCNEELVWDSAYALDTHLSGYDATMKMLKSGTRVTAVLCNNDMLAFGVVKALNELKLKIPEDISVVGCDDIFFSECLPTELSTLRVPKKEMGRQAMNLILKKINDDSYNKLLLNVDFIIRGSTGKCKSL